MNKRILAAIRSQPWAIMPEYMDVIEALALRSVTDRELLALAADNHGQRQLDAVAQMGTRVNGTRTAAFRDGVASLPFFGPLIPRASSIQESSGVQSLASLAADFDALQSMPEVRTILCVFDTPGGMVTDIHAFAAKIATSTKPVHGFVTGNCASAGYWLASQCKELSADPTSVIGSIGIMMSSRVQEAPDSDGRRDVSVISSNAPNKRADLTTEEGQASIRAMLDGLEEIFLQDVARGRGVPVSTVKRDFGAGGTMTGRQAKEVGMIDRVEADGLTGALNRLAKPVRTATPRRAAAALSLEVAQMRAASF